MGAGAEVSPMGQQLAITVLDICRATDVLWPNLCINKLERQMTHVVAGVAYSVALTAAPSQGKGECTRTMRCSVWPASRPKRNAEFVSRREMESALGCRV